MASEDTKKIDRKKFLKLRGSLSIEERQKKDEEILGHFLSLKEYQKAKTIFFYIAKDSEVSTLQMIQAAWHDGKRTVLPRCLNEKDLETRQVQNFELDCEKGAFDILEPRVNRTIEVFKEDIDCFVIPGIAFDLQGVRVGWGKGYFDRYLSDLTSKQVKIGLAYEVQVCKALQIEAHDVKMDALVTEKRVLRF